MFLIVASMLGVRIGFDSTFRLLETLLKKLSDDRASKQGVGAIGRAMSTSLLIESNAYLVKYKHNKIKINKKKCILL